MPYCYGNCKVNAGEKLQTAAEVNSIVITIAASNCVPKKIPGQQHMSTESWTPPPEGLLKINIDGTYVKETRQVAWGFIIREHAGYPVLAGCGNGGQVQ